MDEKKLSYEEKQQIKKQESDIVKDCILATCKRVIYLLEHDAEANRYGYGQYSSAELYNKMHELRRDTKKLENINTRWDYGI